MTKKAKRNPGHFKYEEGSITSFKIKREKPAKKEAGPREQFFDRIMKLIRG